MLLAESPLSHSTGVLHERSIYVRGALALQNQVVNINYRTPIRRLRIAN